MANHKTKINGSPVFIDGPDAFGEATIKGRVWKWEFHKYLGPTFLRKDGEPRVQQPGPKHPVWNAFYRWLAKTDPGDRIKNLRAEDALGIEAVKISDKLLEQTLTKNPWIE